MHTSTVSKCALKFTTNSHASISLSTSCFMLKLDPMTFLTRRRAIRCRLALDTLLQSRKLTQTHPTKSHWLTEAHQRDVFDSNMFCEIAANVATWILNLDNCANSKGCSQFACHITNSHYHCKTTCIFDDNMCNDWRDCDWWSHNDNSQSTSNKSLIFVV